MKNVLKSIKFALLAFAICMTFWNNYERFCSSKTSVRLESRRLSEEGLPLIFNIFITSGFDTNFLHVFKYNDEQDYFYGVCENDSELSWTGCITDKGSCTNVTWKGNFI